MVAQEPARPPPDERRPVDSAHRLAVVAQLKARKNEAVQLALVARFYERIGDHAVNMSERVLYIVTGKVPDHSKPKRQKMVLGDDLAPLQPTDGGDSGA